MLLKYVGTTDTLSHITVVRLGTDIVE